MLRLLSFWAVVFSLVILAPSAEAQKKNKKAAENKKSAAGNGVTPATQVDYAQLSEVKEMVGKVSFVDPGSSTLAVRLESYHFEVNPSYKPPKISPTNPTHGHHGNNGHHNSQNLEQSYHRLMQEQQRAMQQKNPAQRQQALEKVNREMMQLQQRMSMQMMQQQGRQMQQMNQQMSKAMANQNSNNQPYKIVTTAKDFELEMKEKATIRRLQLPLEYDDKGNIKEYSKAELNKLRGSDTSLPGYTAKLDDVAVGQSVKLYLYKPFAKTDGKDKKSSINKEDLTDSATPTKPKVRMVVILEDAPAGTATPAPKAAPQPAKKKNK